MALPCYPVIEPAAAVIRTVRRVVRHKVAAAHGGVRHAAHPAHHGVGVHHGAHGGGAHAGAAPSAHAGAAVPHSGVASQAAPVSVRCVATPGQLPPGPIGAKGLGAYPQFGAAFPGRAPFAGPAGGGFVPATSGLIAPAIGAVLSRSKAALAGGALLAAASGVALGSGALYLEQTGAFNSLIGAPAATSVTTPAVTGEAGGPSNSPALASLPQPTAPVTGSELGSTPGGSGTDQTGPTAGGPGPVTPVAGGDSGPLTDRTPFDVPPDTAPPVVPPAPPEALPPSDTAPVAVPEPATLLLFGLGGLGAALVRRFRRA